ncbi:phosphatase PAP2 family protein [Antrihabitans stalactiti]|uniref:Phosphatase PAP2 family protein n=1 Tax=Antrihabitans stalactiti TaxID=2584121 RepID=A0A848KL72_9NOCA|nr:phosphatase PAP2 family protein [Antrihabitans stalactiti]NMN98638.1 phosphatase PAP2 family protein [Antrihabitans stalactiti]
MNGPRGVVETLITEIVTEVTTAEIAVWTIMVASAVVVFSIFAQRRARSELNVAAILGWSCVRIAALIAVFVVLAVQVARSGWLTGADTATLDWFLAHRSVVWTTLAVAVTTVGGPGGVVLIATVLAAGIGWQRRAIGPAMLVLSPVALAAAASTLVKLVVRRERPPVSAHLMTETDFSFPSGHVTATTALAGAVLLVVWMDPAAGTHTRRTARKFFAIFAAVAVVAAVMLTRLYLGVHWLTDVLAGALLGTTAVLATALVVTAIRLHPDRDREDTVTGHPTPLTRHTVRNSSARHGSVTPDTFSAATQRRPERLARPSPSP